jgi:hypothetical protein
MTARHIMLDAPFASMYRSAGGVWENLCVATASEAIDRTAKAIEIMWATVFRAARFLREHDPVLWPQGSQGRGQEAHVEAHHLVNLVFALAAADPITTAPDVVAELRDLVPLQDDTSTPGLPGATLGSALDLHVARLAASEARGKEARDWWQITVFNGPQFHARIYGQKYSDADAPPEITYCNYIPRQFAKMTDLRDSLLRREVTIRHELILVLADLYGDTLEHRARLLAKPQTKRRPSWQKAVAHA